MPDYFALNRPRPCRVLCVDDEPRLRDVVALVLERHGFLVQTATDGADGWRKISADWEAFDLIITDNQMPHLDGVGLVRQLRAAQFPGKIIMFSSGLHGNRAPPPGLLDGYVEKGTPIEDLLGMVAKVLGGPR